MFSAMQSDLAEIIRIIQTPKVKHRQKRLESPSFTVFFQIIIFL